LYRVKLKQIYDGQEYKDILDLPAMENSDTTLRDILSTYEIEMQVNDAVVKQGEEYAAKSGYDTQSFYTVTTDDKGNVQIVSVDADDISVDEEIDVNLILETPPRTGYTGYLVGDGIPPNGHPFGVGSSFPTDSQENDYFLRTDLLPNRLFRFTGKTWKKVEDNVRADLTQSDTKNTLLGTFINNTNTNTIMGAEVTERQAISTVLKAKADN
jgi:hypothetical protein